MTGIEENAFQAMRIFFTGVGGQGTILATRLVGEAALEEGLPVVMSEIHGMAQRGGVVESSVVVGNVFSPTIADGEADVVLAFEPVEAVRALPKCHAKTVVVSNTVPIVPFTVAVGQSAYPDMESLYALLAAKVGRLVRVDAVALAVQAGSERAVNVAMVGVLAGMGCLPISGANWEKGLEKVAPPRLLDVNLRAFNLGMALGRVSQ